MFEAEGSSAADCIADVADVTDISPMEEGSSAADCVADVADVTDIRKKEVRQRIV
ncbi:hypothetical protein QT972_01195 [Microcoleus sp. herbarium7]|uniref:hypothetical protein n=1 Tax=Microcoleus sp. herbarium7 TaxID=3055435 RepID=UPI002FD3F7A9